MANSTIFDDVFRTMLEKMPQLIIPLINEVFEQITQVIFLLCREEMNIIQEKGRSLQIPICS